MWWIDIVAPILLALGVYGFLAIVGVQTSWLTRKTDRRAEDMYDEFADPPGKRHRRFKHPRRDDLPARQP